MITKNLPIALALLASVPVMAHEENKVVVIPMADHRTNEPGKRPL